MLTEKRALAGALGASPAAIAVAIAAICLFAHQSPAKAADASCSSAAAPTDYAARIQFYDACLASPGLSQSQRVAALTARGVAKMMSSHDRTAFAPGVEDFDEAIRLRPAGGWARIGRGQIRQVGGDLAGARADYDVALASGTNTEKSEAYFYLGYLDAQEGKWAAAVRDFDEARNLRPDLAGVFTSEARLLVTSPDPTIIDAPRAEVLAREAMRLYPDGYRGLEALAAAHAREGKFDQAVWEQQQVIALADKAGDGADTEDGKSLRQALAGYQRHEPLTHPAETWAR